MPSKAALLVARLLWFFPALLFFLTFDQAKVALDLRATWEQGTPAMARVVDYDHTNRADVTFGYVSVEVPLEDGTTLVKEKMALPTTLIGRLADAETLDVRVRPGAPQEVVIASLMPAHWLIAAGQSGMAFMGFLLIGWGVLWWNRSLYRQQRNA